MEYNSQDTIQSSNGKNQLSPIEEDPSDIFNTPSTSRCTTNSMTSSQPSSGDRSFVRGNKRKKKECEEPLMGMLGNISNAIEGVTNIKNQNRDKITDFANYVSAELREFPPDSKEEFMDESIIANQKKNKEIISRFAYM